MFDLAGDKSVSTPFGAVVGQQRLKQALSTIVVDDGLDGLLVTGEKGTAKSTLVRGLAALLPDQRAVTDCPFGCPPDDPKRQCAECRKREDPPAETRPVPLVTLPLGATRERVVGTLSVSDALSGEATFDPGLLARANRGLLYVDEVNLLDDHLVDVLLDAAASGSNRVERDGVSRTHPAEFTLVGTMNPEEGDLRPQLRDRFALSVEVEGERDVEDRVKIIDADLGADDGGDIDDTKRHRDRIVRARELLDSVELTDETKREIAELCLDAGVDGHRADIATARAARALAALDGRSIVTDDDIRQAASLALGHRMRSTPFEDAADAEDVIDDHFEDADGDQGTDDADPSDGDQDAGETTPGDSDGGPSDATDEPSADRSERRDTEDSRSGEDEPEAEPETEPISMPASAGGSDIDEPDSNEGRAGGETSDDDEEATPLAPGQSVDPAARASAPEIDAPEIEAGSGTGRADAAPTTQRGGARVRTEPADSGENIDAAASVRAAATHGRNRVETRDLRQSVRSDSGEALVVFAVDASASMAPAMAATKGVTLELLEGAYTERDSVAVVAFAGEDAEVLLPPTDSVALAARHLKELPTGDRTPLPAGLQTAATVINRADPEAAVVVVVSDGRANAAATPTADTRAAAEALARTEARVVCVDAGDERGLLTDVASVTDGMVVELAALTPERVEDELVRSRR
jgi:magnesium chelatase subunit D